MLMTMMVSVMIAASPAQIKPVATLPSTPQGRQIEVFMKAFNSGDEKTFLDAQEQILTKAALARRDRAERAAMYKRMRGSIGTMSISRVVKASALVIQLKVPTNEGVEADMTFDFEETAPHRIAGIGVEIYVQGQ